MSKSKEIRPRIGFSNFTEGDVLLRGSSVGKGMEGNPAFPNPPVEIAAFKAALDRYSDAIGEALGGGKRAIGVRETERKTVVRMLRLLGAYVEANCNGDMGIFASSGFAAASGARVPAQPLPQPDIRKIQQGNTGQLLAAVTPLAGALHYEVRCAAFNGGAPGEWTTHILTSGREIVSYNNLTPGVMYAFQTRAMGKLGFTDWSDSATRMCI